MSTDTRTHSEAQDPRTQPDAIHGSEPLAWLTPMRGALLVTLLAFTLYLITMNRTFGFIDKGELVAVASTLGISHPTGYPTIMVLGWVVAKVLPLRPVLALNGMSALLTALGAGVLTLLLNDLFGRIAAARLKAAKQKGKAKKGNTTEPAAAKSAASWLHPGMRIAYAACAALFTAFTSIWWNQGNGFEVYSLHAIMLPLVSLLFLRHVDEITTHAGQDGTAASGFTRTGTLFAFTLGLSFTNHLTTILLAPAFLVYYAWSVAASDPQHRGISALLNGPALLRLARLVPAFILGLLPYLWLPIRAGMQPRFNWGNTTTLDALYRHVSGRVYQEWMFNSSKVFAEQTAFFFGNLPGEMAFAGLIVAVLGIVRLARQNARLSVWVALLFAACILYSGNYDIMEIGPYYMTAMFALGIWFAFGLVWLHEKLGTRTALGLAGALVVLNVAVNYSASDESGNTLVEDMTVNVLDNLPKDAVVFSQQWDFWVAGSFYMQGVENHRPDVMVIDPELLRRTWYLDQLEHNYPTFMQRVKPEVEQFRKEVYKFDHNLPYDGNVIQTAYVGMMNAMVDRHITERPVLVTPEVDPAVGAAYRRTPDHLAMRLMRDSTYLPQEFPKYRFEFWGKRLDSYTAKIYELYARSAYMRARYEAFFNKRDMALRYYDLALSYDPGFERRDIGDLPLDSETQVENAIMFFEQVRQERATYAATAR